MSSSVYFCSVYVLLYLFITDDSSVVDSSKSNPPLQEVPVLPVLPFPLLPQFRFYRCALSPLFRFLSLVSATAAGLRCWSTGLQLVRPARIVITKPQIADDDDK